MSTFGSCLKKLRLKKKLSQRELSDRALVSRSYIAMVESGSRNPYAATKERIVDALGMSMSSFYSYEKNTKNALLIKDTPGKMMLTTHGYAVMGVQDTFEISEDDTFDVTVYVSYGLITVIQDKGSPTYVRAGSAVRIMGATFVKCDPGHGAMYTIIMERIL